MALPHAYYMLQTQNTWPSRLAPTELPYTWSTDAGGCISIASGSIYGNKAGSASISTTIQGKTLTVPVTVTPVSISSASVALSGTSYTYDGTAKEPSVSSVTLNGKVLSYGTDYTVAWSSNVNAGTATVTVTGKGNYTGTAKAAFTIVPADMKTYQISEISSQTYTGSAIQPAVTVGNLKNGTDYTVSYANHTNAGIATVTVTGKGNYAGTLSGNFTIAPADIKNNTIAAIAAQAYTGSAISPAVAVGKLKSGTDYDVACSNNVNVGTASVTVTGKGNYTGTLTGSFAIVPADIKNRQISSIAAQMYTGSEICPEVTVNGLKSGTDYTVSYANNIKTGTATVTVTGKGNYTGTLKKTFQIKDPVTPAKGTKVKDTKTGATYKITKAGKTGKATVEYVKPTSSKATVKIPDTVVIDNVTCKVTSVASSAFKNNKKVKTVTIGKYVTSIGKNAFYGCKKLQKVTIGKSVKTIGASAFYGCTKLSSVTLGAKVTTIGAKAFCKCTALRKVTLPASVKTIGKRAFYGSKNLRSITVKTTKLTTKTVGSKAFGGIYSKAVFKVPSKKVSAYKKLLKARGISTKARVTR